MTTDETMEEAAHISFNNAVAEVRSKEYPMLRGQLPRIHYEVHTNNDQVQPTLTTLALRFMQSRS